MLWQPGCRRRIGVSLIAAVVVGLVAVPAALGVERVYWANGNNDTISYANLDGTGGGNQLNLSGASPNGPRGVDIDPVTRRLYWANQNAGHYSISYVNLDGSGGGNQLNTTGATVSEPHGVAIDPVTRRIYWANGSGNPIGYANLDGSGGNDLDTTGATAGEPYGLAIDPVERKIYWSNRTTVTISWAKLDGSGGDQLDIGSAYIKKPHGVTIDPVARKVYWSNYPGDPVSYANLDGSGGAVLDTTGASASGPVGLAVDKASGFLWLGNLGSNKITYAGLDGAGGGGVLDTTGATLSGSRFLVLDRAPHGTAAPAISGDTALGSVLSCSQGTWSDDLTGTFLYWAPKTFSYQWSRDGTDIAGATANVYTAFVGGDYRCRVTASNEAGDTSQTSAPHTVSAPPTVTSTGGAGGGGAFPDAPARASFVGAKSLIKVDGAGRFHVTFRAPGALTGKATFTTLDKIRVSRRTRAKRHVGFIRTFRVPASGRVTLGIALSKENLRILMLNGRIRIRVTVILRNAAGMTSTAGKTVTLKAP